MRARLSLLLVLLLAPVPAPAAPHHFELIRSSPAAKTTVKAGPDLRVQLWFNQAPAAGVSRVALENEQGAVAVGKTVIVAKEKLMYIDPVKPLSPGSYTINWRGAGDDGHVMSGAIAFVVTDK